jgi:tetratricopeptide (TPR) repeat protein
VFAQLAIFRGGWTLEAYEAVADGTSVDTLSALVDHNLVMRDQSRFRMLETIREYAAERFSVMVDCGLVQRRHADWCVALAEAAELQLEGPDQGAWFERLDAERENLRAASIWAAQHDELDISLRIDGALCLFWLTRGAAIEILGTLTPALTSGKGAPASRAKALNSAAILSALTGDLASARASVEAALDLATELRDTRQIARALTGLSVLAIFAKDYNTALARATEAAEVSREARYVRGEHNAYHNMAVARALMGQIDQATSLASKSVEVARTTGDRLGLTERIMLLTRLMVHHRPGDPQVRHLLTEGFALSLSMGNRPRLLDCLELTAAVSVRTPEPAVGAALLGAAEAERKRARIERPPDESKDYETTVDHLQRALGPECYKRERDEGCRWSVEAAVNEALRIVEREESQPSLAATGVGTPAVARGLIEAT